MSKTLYEILELIPSASAETIKAAYRSLIKRYHPDKAGADGLRRSQELNEAYEVLSDPDRRAAYDARLIPNAGVSDEPHVQPEPTARTEPETARVEVAVSASANGDRVISAAIANAAPGTLIRIRPGVYHEFLNLDREIEIAGDGPVEEIVVESTEGSCVEMQTDRAVVRGLTLRSKAAATGRTKHAVWVAQGQLMVEDCDIVSDSLSNVWIKGADAELVMRRCRVHDGNECGIYFGDAAKGTVEDCDFYGNGASYPAGVYVDGGADPILRNCRIRDGKVYGVMVSGGKGIFENCDISGNAVAAVFVTEQGDPVFRDCTIRDTREAEDFAGSGIWAQDHGRGTFERCEIYNNHHFGVNITKESAPLIVDCNVHDEVIGFRADEQGAGLVMGCTIARCSKACATISDQSTSTFRQCHLRKGSVGVVFLSGGRGLFEDTQISDMDDRGVWVVQNSDPVFRNCQIYGNGKFGVGNSDNGNGTFEDCDIFNNRDSGVALDGTGSIFRRCNIRQNAGLGVFASAGARGVVEYCNLTGNKSGPILVHQANTVERGNRNDGITVHYTGP